MKSPSPQVCPQNLEKVVKLSAAFGVPRAVGAPVPCCRSAEQIPIFVILLLESLVPLSKIHVFPGELVVHSQIFLSFFANHQHMFLHQ